MAAMNRLCEASLANLPAEVERPRYDRASLRPGILHLGLGAFHRAHQAVYTERVLNASGGDWGIIGVAMRSETAARQLEPQEGLYSVLSEDHQGRNIAVIGAITRVIVAPQDPGALDTLLSDPRIGVVTLTITEKGYCLGADGRSLDRSLPQVCEDLKDPENARGAIGILARGLWCRYRQGGAPITVISCDNLGENSARLQAVLQDYLQSTWPEVLPWLAQSAAFPCSMVDRIVPAMTAAGRDRQAQLLGVRDEGAVATEPFSQWIIEDRFATPVPDWASVGARLVDNIRPYEEIKLRLLNASHSAIAMAGLLTGKETVSDVMADPVLAGFVGALMTRELMPALDAPAGFDLEQYRDQLLQRFANSRLRHRCAQIAMDSSEKIRQRWLETLQEQSGDTLLLRALACWCFLVLQTEQPVEDPRADSLLTARASRAGAEARLQSVLACAGIAPDQLWLGDERFGILCRLVAELAVAGTRGLLGSAPS